MLHTSLFLPELINFIKKKKKVGEMASEREGQTKLLWKHTELQICHHSSIRLRLLCLHVILQREKFNEENLK